MVNTEKLKAKMKDSGYKFEWVASQLNIHRASLQNKIEGRTEFKASEIQKLGELLNMTAQQRDSIFFA